MWLRKSWKARPDSWRVKLNCKYVKTGTEGERVSHGEHSSQGSASSGEPLAEGAGITKGRKLGTDNTRKSPKPEDTNLLLKKNVHLRYICSYSQVKTYHYYNCEKLKPRTGYLSGGTLDQHS